MKNVMKIELAAAGNPSEVAQRIGDQAQALAATPDRASIAAAVRTVIVRGLEGISEDETVAVEAVVSVTVGPAPATVIARREAEAESRAAQDRIIADLRTQIAALTKEG